VQEPESPMVVKGEFVIVLGPTHSVLYSDLPPVKSSSARSDGSVQQVCIDLLSKLEADGVSRSEAVRIVADTGTLPKSAVYKLALSMDWS
jgi:16S rRNA C1402 (ribose-2'-O) methylase RsmI